MQLIKIAGKIDAIARESIETNLGPGCVSTFKKAQDAACIMKQMCKAELETHMKKGKW